MPILTNLKLGPNPTVNLTLSNPTGGGMLGPQSTSVLSIVNPNTLVVTNTNDTGPGSLRQAILTADANPPGPLTISFDIPGNGPDIIQPLSALPALTVPVTIDGTTEPGYQGTPLVILDGIHAGAEADGLDLNAGASRVVGLSIDRFSANGIALQGVGGDTVAGCFIGTDAPGDALGNGFNGILINDVPGNTIGGQGNVISGNGQVGIRVVGTSASGNTILGNRIGTDPSGTRPLGNGYDGIFIDGAPDNTIGSTIDAERNVISGNREVGVQLFGSTATGNTVLGNLIGTDTNGQRALANGLDGIFVNDSANNRLTNNLISGNASVGVRLSGSGASGNVVSSNLIGTSSDGGSALGNGYDGIFVNGAPNNQLTDNVVSGNRSVGIQLLGSGAAGNQIQGNRVGTDPSGQHALGNGLDGIYINAAPGNTIGGTATGEGNLLAANGSAGLQIFGPSSTGNVVTGNTIGGASPLGNAYGLFLNNTGRNSIPSTGPATNQIVGNTVSNVFIATPGNTSASAGSNLSHNRRNLHPATQHGTSITRRHVLLGRLSPAPNRRVESRFFSEENAVESDTHDRGRLAQLVEHCFTRRMSGVRVPHRPVLNGSSPGVCCAVNSVTRPGGDLVALNRLHLATFGSKNG